MYVYPDRPNELMTMTPSGQGRTAIQGFFLRSSSRGPYLPLALRTLVLVVREGGRKAVSPSRRQLVD